MLHAMCVDKRKNYCKWKFGCVLCTVCSRFARLYAFFSFSFVRFSVAFAIRILFFYGSLFRRRGCSGIVLWKINSHFMAFIICYLWIYLEWRQMHQAQSTEHRHKFKASSSPTIVSIHSNYKMYYRILSNLKVICVNYRIILSSRHCRQHEKLLIKKIAVLDSLFLLFLLSRFSVVW